MVGPETSTARPYVKGVYGLRVCLCFGFRRKMLLLQQQDGLEEFCVSYVDSDSDLLVSFTTQLWVEVGWLLALSVPAPA